MTPQKPEVALALAPVPVARVALGVRYEVRWSVADRLGAIVDRILRQGGTPFTPEMFPRTIREESSQTILNPETQDSLRITQQDTILDQHLDTRDLTAVTDLGEQFDRYVLTPLREVADVRDIIRYGMLFRLAECQASLGESPVQRFLGNDFENVRALTMRFERRLPAMEAFVRKGVNDFRNVFYVLDQAADGEVNLAMDYQHYFAPPLGADEWNKRPFSSFVGHGVDFARNEFMRWFEKFAAKHEAA
jgi:hypothetical protein